MRKGAVIPGLLLILLDIYFLLGELGIGIHGWDVIWPVFPFAGGLAFLGGYVFGQRRDPGLVFVGTAATLVGLWFFFIALGPLEYRDLGMWWPVFVLIGSAAFLAQWAAAGFRDWGALFMALVALTFGLVARGAGFRAVRLSSGRSLPAVWSRGTWGRLSSRSAELRPKPASSLERLPHSRC
nr:hypothetical protein [Anaerolineae bacterium]